MRFAKRDEPLFIRRTASPKRLAGAGGNRYDPTEQLKTLHINPFYKQSGRLTGKHVVVVDDCTKYGMSFGIASALLEKAGATDASGVALGKFGDKLTHFEIAVTGDLFKLLSSADYVINSKTNFNGAASQQVQQDLLALIG